MSFPKISSRCAVVGALIFFIVCPRGLAASAAVSAGQNVSLSVTAGGTAPFTYQWHKDNIPLSGATNAVLAITGFQSANAGAYHVAVANAYGSTLSDVATLSLSTQTPPLITTQPISQTIVVGSSATFSAAASGSPAPTFQWKKNGVAISGATLSAYSIASATTGDAASYTITATNSAGAVTSATAVLTVSPLTMVPAITAQPAHQTVVAGSDATFSVSATGTPAPTYQWRKNGAAITGATSTTYALIGVTAGQAGTFTVLVSNSAGSVVSNGAVLTVNSPPAITTQPISQTIVVGSSATFSAAASGSPAPVFQWKKNGVAISGATSSSYTLANVALNDAGTYSVTASNLVGAATSASATLTVNTAVPPTILTQPENQAVLNYSRVTFSVLATGNPAVTYQWRKDGQNISKATGPSFTISRTQSRNTGVYSVVVTNSAGTAISDLARLTIRSTPPPLAVSVDFNGDGQSDILCQNNVTGERSVWLMAGTVKGSTVALAQMATDWEIAGAGDFNKDGLSDIVWQNYATGECRIWLMNGTKLLGSAAVGTVTLEWELAGAGDFNADGNSDLVWQNSLTGERTLWLMNGTALNTVISLGSIALEWELVGTGDFNADRGSDLLLQNRLTGECGVWLMNRTTRSAWVSVGQAAAGTALVGSGDFNGDNQSDLLWQNLTSGQRSLWLMNGTQPMGTKAVATVAAEWTMQN